MNDVCMLDFGAGNVRSLVNAVKRNGGSVRVISTAAEIAQAPKLIFPGVGAFGSAMAKLEHLGVMDALRDYVRSGRPFLGICIGLQSLFEASEESPGVAGLGIIPATIRRFSLPAGTAVPHMGWNSVRYAHSEATESLVLPRDACHDRFYFVHSFMAPVDPSLADWTLATTRYGDCDFISAVQRGNVFASQFHPEKSGLAGVRLLERFLQVPVTTTTLSRPIGDGAVSTTDHKSNGEEGLAKRIIACLDVRSNDQGDIVVTKGDQYDVRDTARDVRNLGKPVELARRYFEAGADEITLLNITSFRDCPLSDQPMLKVLEETSEQVFVPLTIGGGIRDTVDPDGTVHGALEVAALYFRSGADKVSIGTDAVKAAQEYIATGVKTGVTSIETIAHAYGAQAVVISVDPVRQFVAQPSDTKHHTFESALHSGPNGERYVWYQCTVKGGRERVDLGAYELARACEALGAGEILLNLIDNDGQKNGFDSELIASVKGAVSIPVIASSGAGCAQHFVDVFRTADPDAALAAGIFHREEVPLSDVKALLRKEKIPVRL